MKIIVTLVLALLLALWLGAAPDSSVPGAPSAPSQQGRKHTDTLPPAGPAGMSLAGFVDVWSGRPSAQVKQPVEPPAVPSAQQLTQERIARFHEGRMRRAAARLRPGELLARHEADRPKEHVPTAEDVIAARQRAEQIDSRIERFKAARAQRIAQVAANGLSPGGRAAGTADLRPGDKVGARPGDLASLQRR